MLDVYVGSIDDRKKIRRNAVRVSKYADAVSSSHLQIVRPQ